MSVNHKPKQSVVFQKARQVKQEGILSVSCLERKGQYILSSSFSSITFFFFFLSIFSDSFYMIPVKINKGECFFSGLCCKKKLKAVLMGHQS